MSYTANLQSIFRSLSGALLVPNPQDQGHDQQPPGGSGLLTGVGVGLQDPRFHHHHRRSQHSLTDLHHPGMFGPQHQQPPYIVGAGGNYVLGRPPPPQRSRFSDGSLPRTAMPGQDAGTTVMPSGGVGDQMDMGQDMGSRTSMEDDEDEENEQDWEDDEDAEVSDEMDEDEEDEEDGAGDDKSKEVQAQERQAELRKRIMIIQQDTSIPAAEKAKKIQELMTQGWSQKQQTRASQNSRVTNRLENRRRDFNEVTDADRQPTFHDKANGVLGCKHYQRAAKLQAHCCGKWDTCRFCHDEVSDHNIVRNLITTMMCMYCGTVQSAGQDCINDACRRRVSKYYCKECKLWDSDPRKNIYHCYDCGICRIGKGLGIDYFHCKKCNVCMAISLKGRHKCIERNLESDCPICGEYMFTSTTTVIFMPCFHCIHYKCHQEYIQTSYQCPTCLKSLADMTDYFRRIDQALAQQQMPPEYSNLYNQIYCNDCEKKCFAKFHFMYHKCTTCRGYNTKVLHTADKSQVPPEELRQINAMHTALLAASAPPAPGGAGEGDAAGAGGAGGQEHVVTGRHSASGSRRSSVARGSSRRASMVQRGVQFWCHQCQASTTPVMVAGSQRCGTCDSDFLEQL